MLERAWFDATALDERVDFLLLQSDHSPESVGGQQSFVDEAVERAVRDAEALRGSRRLQPSDLLSWSFGVHLLIGHGHDGHGTTGWARFGGFRCVFVRAPVGLAQGRRG